MLLSVGIGFVVGGLVAVTLDGNPHRGSNALAGALVGAIFGMIIWMCLYH